MTYPATIPFTFGAETSGLTSQLDQNFTNLQVGLNGLGNGSSVLSSVAITTASITSANIAAMQGNVVITGGTAILGLANITTMSSSNVVITGGTAILSTANVSTLGTATINFGDGTTQTTAPSTTTPHGFVNILRGNSLSSWENGTTGTITTSGGWAASGVYVIPTGTSVGFAQLTGQQPGYYALQLQGATGITDLQIRFVVESLQASTLAFSAQATFQILVFQSSGGSITPTITVKHAGAADNWSSPVTDVNAQNMGALANSTQQKTAYTFNTSAGMGNGVEVVVDFGNNWGTAGKNVVIYAGFDLRATPGVATGINTSPPTPEIRDPQSDIAWCQRFFASSYQNGVAPGTSVAFGVGGSVTVASSTPGPIFIPFPAKMRTAPASISYWDVNGNASKVSYLALGTTSLFNHNIAASAAPGSIMDNGFIFVGGTTAGSYFLNYTADARITGG